MNYAEIKKCDIANGAGVRTSLFVSGCRHRCPNCFNALAWDFMAGQPFDEKVEQELLDSLAPDYVDGLSILGGEPLEPENQEVLAPFLERVREAYPTKSIWMWTGFTWEELMEAKGRSATPFVPRILNCLDVLVDGPFIEAQKDLLLRFRGSSNQRIINVRTSRAAGELCLWQDEKIFSTHTW
ncbi:MAG: anaerobic ribonucleoside-triphosphate reductase activating protein [Coriobacteriales bacterium]|nr:anaerobic ribonucleoside-triphosphate reductase activating protein [Coriobacteriales bacterium]